MKYIPFFYLAFLLLLTSCTKNNRKNIDIAKDFDELKTAGIRDFVDIVAIPTYSDLYKHAQLLHGALSDINANKGDLSIARDRWKAMRSVWEKSEGFLFGPVSDNHYDPYMDTWPTDYRQMDSLLAANIIFTADVVKTQPLSLRGYHPIEYIIYGNNGTKKIDEITPQQKQYMMALAEDLKNTCNDLLQNWISQPTNYAVQFKTAGKSDNDLYPTQQSAYLALVSGMIGICEEVGGGDEGKIGKPLLAQDSKIVESPYSANSIRDFKDNIVGLQNVYLCHYNGKTGASVSDLVATRNRALDIKIKTQIYTAINSFDNITLPFKEAIISQRMQCQQTIDALNILATTLEDELKPFVQQFIN